MGQSSGKSEYSDATFVANPAGSAEASEPLDEDHAGVMGAVPDLGDDEEGSSSEEEEEEEDGDKGTKSFEAKVMMYSIVEGVVKYSLRVKRREGGEIVSSWVIQKRYTDFEKLLKLIQILLLLFIS